MAGKSSILRTFVLLLIYCFLPADNFNMDLETYKTFAGSEGSEFGYALQMLVDNGQYNILVGAPKEKISQVMKGAMKICDGLEKESEANCREIVRQERAPNQFTRGFIGENYGSSIAASPTGQYYACAPQWKDVRVERRENRTNMPGRCELNRPVGMLSPFYHTVSSEYVKVNGNTGFISTFHSQADFGVSATFDQGSVFIFGSPGIHYFEGSAFAIDTHSQEQARTQTVVKNNIATTAYSYLGYTVVAGKFCSNTNIKACFAAGATDGKHRGKVHIYEWPKGRTILIKVHDVDAEQMWSNFGTVMCAANVDDDSYDELIVGAPLFTNIDDIQEGMDQGRVYVYKKGGDSFDKVLILEGDKKKYGAFGSAVGNIGDINLDGFEDIIVGAPGEEERRGCVYIYLGSSSGLFDVANQKICASQISNPKIKGFGSAFSANSLSKTKYPIVAVGNFLSDNIVAFKCRTIVDVASSITVRPSEIKTTQVTNNKGKTHVLDIQFCMNKTSRGEKTGPRVFDVKMSIDATTPYSSNKRAYFIKGRNEVSYTTEISGIIVDKMDACRNVQAFLKPEQVQDDKYSALEIVAEYTMRQNETTGPMLDTTKSHIVSKKVPFDNECGPDNLCTIDLQTEGYLTLQPDGNDIVVNQTKEVLVHINITNTGETSYNPYLSFNVNQPIDMKSFSLNVVRCTAEILKHDTKIMCTLTKPMSPNTKETVTVGLVADSLLLDKEMFSVSVEAGTSDGIFSTDVNENNNKAYLRKPIFIEADVSADGSSSPSVIAVENIRILKAKESWKPKEGVVKTSKKPIPKDVVLKFQTKNLGPSFLPQTYIVTQIPVYLPDGTQLVRDIKVKLSTGSKDVACARYTGDPTIPETIDSKTTKKVSSRGTTQEPITAIPTLGPVKRRKRSNARDNESETDVDDNTVYTLGCKHNPALCHHYRCEIKTIDPGYHTEMTVALTFDTNNIAIPEKAESLSVMVLSSVLQPDHILWRSWTEEQSKQAFAETQTMFDLIAKKKKASLWIIAVSALVGLFIIFVIGIILWRCGFFKRKRMMEVKQWKRESQRRSKISSMAVDSEKVEATEGQSINGGDSGPPADLKE